VTINGTDARILPRLRLLPTPYAFLAARAATADQALSVNGSAIAAGSIQQDRLSASVISNILQAPIPDSRLSANITSGPIADSRLSANITNGPIADSRLTANIPRKNEANIFTGDQTINGNLTVTNNLSLGSAGQFKVAAGNESLRIVRGRVKLIYERDINWGYQVVNGANFTVSEKPLGYTPQEGISFVGHGIVDIRFDPPFADIPAITVTRWNEAGMYAGSTPWVAWVTVLEVTPSQATVSFMGFPNSFPTYVDAPFHFIAVGAR